MYMYKRHYYLSFCSERRKQTSMNEQVVEWFRSFLGAQWNYVVVWKLGDDPSRFIEWMGCCCSGGNVEEERTENSHLSSLCRDTCFKHPVRTKACEALSQLPSSMPLYSGVHTDVVISRQPRWLSQVEGSDSYPSHNFSGTLALIPVEDGLIELYATKNIPKNQKVLELILAHCNSSLKQENLDILPQTYVQKQPSFSNLVSLGPRSEVFQQVSRSGSHTSTEGPSNASSSNISNEHLLFGSNCVYESQYQPSKSSYENTSGLKKLDYNEDFLKQQASLVSGCEAEKTAKKVTKRKEKGNYKSTNLISERNRRKRIKMAQLTLRSLVPNITKMDTASIIGDAVNYIRELQKEEKELQEELKKMEEEEEKELQKSKDRLAIPESNEAKFVSSCLPPAANNPTFGQKMKTEMQVDVKQVGKRECFVKVFYEHMQGSFVRLMEAIDSIELQVVNCNLTTFNGRVQNILEVKADKDIQAVRLKNLLIELVD